MNNNKQWIEFRESYLDWLADWPKEYNVKNLLVYKGYSLWWSSNLIKKDTIINNEWLVKLYHRLCDVNISKSSNYKSKRTVMYMPYLFILDVYRFLVIKLILKAKSNKKSDIYFYSLELNLIKKDGVPYDRHYGAPISEKNESGLSASYLLNLSNNYIEILNPYKYHKKINRLLSTIDSNVIVLDSYLKLTDIISVHAGIFKIYCKFLIAKRRNDFNKSFFVNGVSCRDILVPELEQSFYGGFQSSLLSSIQFFNWSNEQNQKLTIVSYLETLSAARSIYYFGRKSVSKCTFIGLQHSTIYRNKIDFYNRRKEFNYSYQGGIEFSPQPDYYLLHGQYSKDLIQEFMDIDRLKIIGCLKFDNFPLVLSKIEKIKKKVISQLEFKNRYIVVLAPSFGVDIDGMLNLFKDIKYDSNKIKFIISPHPLVSVDEISNKILKMGISNKFDFYPNISTQEIIIAADLVVCGYSSIALESVIFKTHSVRVVQKQEIPMFEEEYPIQYITNKKEFWDYIYTFIEEGRKNNFLEENKKLVTKFFYKIDGKSHQRMWKFLSEL
jgi:hypothetical protein